MDTPTSSSSSTCMNCQLQSFLFVALAIFQHILNHESVRSVHAYKEEEDGEEETWVEREFVFTATACMEVSADVPRKFALLGKAVGKGWPKFHVGHKVGLWKCILAYDSKAPGAPSVPKVPPIFSLCRNSRLKSVPTLARDLERVLKLGGFNGSNEPEIFSSGRAETEDESSSYQAHLYCARPVIIQHLPKYQQHKHNVIEKIAEAGEIMKKKKRNYKRAPKKYVASIALADIEKCFDLPENEACRQLKIGATVLKKKCREFGIKRWPHRKLKSLDSLINKLQEEANQQERENQAVAAKAVIRRQHILESEKEGIERKPCMELQTETKKFRQDVFKRKHIAKVRSSKCQQNSIDDRQVS